MQRASEGRRCMVQRVRLHSYTMQRSGIRTRPLRGFHLSNLQSCRRPQDDTNTPPATTPRSNPLTTVEINQNDPDTYPNVTPPTPADFWTKITPTNTDFLKKMLLWNSPLEAPICNSQQKQNWTLLHRMPQHYIRWSCRKIAKLGCSTLFAMVMPHLVLARTKEKRETSIVKTI